MINVMLHGCKGRMGQAIEKIIENTEGMRVACGVDKAVDGTESYPALTKISDCNVPADVVLDFSHFSAIPSLLEYCTEKNLPVVVATTSLGSEEEAAVMNAAEAIPVFYSFNMSLGINVIAELFSTMVPVLENDFDVEIIDNHHNKKKDSPSGTALLLADAINANCEKKKRYIYGRHTKEDDRTRDIIGIHSIRGGTTPGVHTVLFAGDDELIEITHTALSRNIFAKGAVKAAAFLVKQAKGLYSMKDLIALRK